MVGEKQGEKQKGAAALRYRRGHTQPLIGLPEARMQGDWLASDERSPTRSHRRIDRCEITIDNHDDMPRQEPSLPMIKLAAGARNH